MNHKIIVLSIAVIALVSMVVTTTQISNIVYADSDSKTKRWEGENTDDESESSCGKSKEFTGCKDFKDIFGAPLNKFTKDSCESGGDKCKQVKVD